MPFFAFGHKEDSWVIGNDLYLLTHNFPRPGDDAGLLGNIEYVALGANNMQAWIKKNGPFYMTIETNLSADVNSGLVDHLAFNPSGGWFISYRGGQARLSMEGTFSEIFHRDAAKFITTKGPGSYALQYSTLWKVFFGAGGSYIFQFRNGRLQWCGIAEKLSTELTTMLNTGWILTSRTCLSPHSKQGYFIEWTKNFAPSQFHTPQYRFQYSYNLPESSMLKPLFVRQIVEGQYPTEIPTEEKPIGSEVAGSRLSVESIREMSVDLFDELSEGGRITGQAFKSFIGEMIPNEDMVKIWNLTDLDHNGEYSLDEFTLAWYLILRRFGGSSVPKEIPMAVILRAKASNPTLARRASVLENSSDLRCAGCLKDIFNTVKQLAAWFYLNADTRLYWFLCPACYCFRCPEHLTTLPFKWTLLRRVNYYGEGQYRCQYCTKVLENTDIMFDCRKCNFGYCTSCHRPPVTHCPNNHVLIKRTVEDSKKSVNSIETSFGQLNISSTNTNFNPSNPFSSNSKPGRFSTQSSSSSQPNSNWNNAPTKQEDDGKPVDSSSLKQGEKELREALSGQILKESPNVTWDDIAGLEAAKEELQEAVIFPIKFPKMFTSKRKPRRGILLYGPPGTGKSYLAKAVATEAGYTLFSISSSDVTSKWLGESERLVKTLFKLARENKPSVIFIDELDALCGSRDTPGHNPHMQGLKTEFMVQIDGVGSDNDGVLVLAATNLPWSLDPAIRRRFQRKLYIPLPDEEARAEMFKIHVGESMAELTDKDYASLARKTPGLSGSDISIAVQDALMQPVKKISSSKHWRKVMVNGEEKLTPCKPTDRGALPMTWRKVPNSKLLEPKVEVEDFFTVLEKTKPTVSEEDIKKCSDWTDQFGTEGA